MMGGGVSLRLVLSLCLCFWERCWSSLPSPWLRVVHFLLAAQRRDAVGKDEKLKGQEGKRREKKGEEKKAGQDQFIVEKKSQT